MNQLLNTPSNPSPKHPLNVLFICIGNTCRSPMAEAIARQLGGGSVVAYSAGLTPTGRVAKEAFSALSSLGYAADGLASKGLDDVPLADMDVIVSLLGSEGLRFLPTNTGASLEAWPIRDPYGDDQEVFVSVALVIEQRVKTLLHQLAEETFSL